MSSPYPCHRTRSPIPQGLRWAFRDWDLPWSGLAGLPSDRPVPPRPGDRWRLFLGRFQKLQVSGRELMPHPAWTWTCQAVYDTHRPEEWLEVEFRDEDVTANPA